MNKNFVYITQSPDFIPPFVEELESRGREVYILTYRKPVRHKRNIFMPQSTWGQGRNFVARLLKREKYLYNIFLDEDTTLKVRDSFSKYKNKNVWDLYEEFLLKYEPSIGLPRYTPRNYTKEGEEVNTLYQYDHIILGIHRDVMPLHFPLATQFDHISWYWSQVLINHVIAVACPSSILQCNYIDTYNGGHVSYPQVCSFGFLTKLLKQALLDKNDQKRLLKYEKLGKEGSKRYTSYWFQFRGDGEYVKPYNGQYKDLINAFKTRIDKKSSIWKHNPFINA